MAKKKASLDYTIDAKHAMELVASHSKSERRDRRLELGRISNLADLTEEQASFFYGECLVFSQVSEDINDWIRENFADVGGTVTNYPRMRDLYEFYLALTSDVDIRYELVREADGEYDIVEPNIVPNDFYIKRQL